jgi:hypothetical protein
MCAFLPTNRLCVAIAVRANVRTLSRTSVTLWSAVLAGEHVVDEAPDVAAEAHIKEPRQLVASVIEDAIGHLAVRTAAELVGNVIAPEPDVHVVIAPVLSAGKVDADEVA